MALIDKIDNDADGHIAIPSHEFSAAMLLWATGEITRANVISAFSLETSDEAQLDQLSTFYGTLTATQKAAFHGTLEAATIALQGGYINQTKYKSILGLT